MSRIEQNIDIVLASLNERIKDLETGSSMIARHRELAFNLPIYASPALVTASGWEKLLHDSSLDLEARGIREADLTDEFFFKELGIELKDIDPRGDFAALRPADIAVAFTAGLAGAFASAYFEEVLDKIHKVSHCAEKSDNPVIQYLGKVLKHNGSPMDKMRGRKHRLKYGHDILNPFEVWDDLAEQYGGNRKALLHWAKHLMSDSLSKEGLPLPGSSYFRDFLQENFTAAQYQKYLTVKSRDLAGASLVEGILRGYRFCEKVKGGEPIRENYRFFQTNVMAHSVCFVSGIMLGSLNYGSLALMCVYVARCLLFDRQVSRRIDIRFDELERLVSES
jgi:hypothetical protein